MWVLIVIGFVFSIPGNSSSTNFIGASSVHSVRTLFSSEGDCKKAAASIQAEGGKYIKAICVWQ